MELDLDWSVCPDGYRLEKREAGRLVGTPGGLFIVANSAARRTYKPLDKPDTYLQLAKCDPSPEGALEFVRRNGFLVNAEADDESVDEITDYIIGMQQTVKAIRQHDWRAISKGLEHKSIGRLGILFKPPKEGRDYPPILKFRPPTLLDALQAQALLDSSLGVKFRKCKNPECERYFQATGPNAYRADALYHSPECRSHHAYLKRIRRAK